MRILIAEDDPISLKILKSTLSKWGHDLVLTYDGKEALDQLQSEHAPKLAILDWMMPKINGVDVCRAIRESQSSTPIYLIILTAKTESEFIAEGLDAGADDYITKPFDPVELRSRIEVGKRVVELQSNLATRIGELEEALRQVKELRGLLPICSYCKKIRDDGNYWHQVESYISTHSEAQFSHGICPTCFEVHVEPELQALQAEMKTKRGKV